MRSLSRGMVAIALVVLVVLEFVLTGAFFEGGAIKDYLFFVASGRGLASGNPYPLIAGAANLNPPSLLPLCALLAMAPIPVGWLLLVGAGFLGYLASGVALLRHYRRPSPLLFLWLLAFAPLWHGLFHGQIWPLLTPFAVFGWLALKEHRPILAGVLIGVLVAVKINFGAWIAFLLLVGELGAVIAASLSFLVLSILPAILYGPRVYLDWLAGQRAATGQEIAGSIANGTLIGTFTRAGLPLAGDALAALAFLALAFLAWRSKDHLTASRLGLLAALICSPIAWFGYAVCLLPLYLERPWSPRVWLAAIVSLLPLWLLWGPASVHPSFAVLANLLALLPLLLLASEVAAREMPLEFVALADAEKDDEPLRLKIGRGARLQSGPVGVRLR